MRVARALVAAAALMLSASEGAAEPAIALRAAAGLDGVCKVGRRIPLIVTVENTGADLIGEIVVEWGNASAVREVTLPAGSRKRIDMYPIAGDSRDAVTIRLRASGRQLAAAEVRVRPIAGSHPLVVCVGVTGSLAGDAACSATVPPDALPASWRGYDGVDALRWLTPDAPRIDAARRRALERWRSLRAHADALQTAVAGVEAESGRALDAARAPVVAYVAIVLLAASAAALFRPIARRPRWVYVAVLLTIASGSAAAWGVGQIGPGADLIVRGGASTHTFDGQEAAYVRMRGEVRMPAADALDLRGLLQDAVLTTRGAAGGETVERQDQDGFPVLRGRFGMGETIPFTLDGFVDDPQPDPARLIVASRRVRATVLTTRIHHQRSEP
jgi:hypothetical protein